MCTSIDTLKTELSKTESILVYISLPSLLSYLQTRPKRCAFVQIETIRSQHRSFRIHLDEQIAISIRLHGKSERNFRGFFR